MNKLNLFVSWDYILSKEGLVNMVRDVNVGKYDDWMCILYLDI